MWSYATQLTSNQYHWGVGYTSLEDEWIEDDIYDEIAAAADELYDIHRELATQAEMQRLAQVDAYVRSYGTDEAEQMLGEIFKNKR